MLISQVYNNLAVKPAMMFQQLHANSYQLYSISPHEQAPVSELNCECTSITTLYVSYRALRDVSTLREDMNIWLSILPRVTHVIYSVIGGVHLQRRDCLLNIHIDHPFITSVVDGHTFVDVFEFQEFLLSKSNESTEPYNRSTN